MWFGQKLFRKDDQKIHGKWIPFATRQEAVDADCDLVSVLGLCISPAQYKVWSQANPGQRLEVPFHGPFYADFDSADDLNSLKDHLVRDLWDLKDDFSLTDDAFHLWFSGAKGFHLLIPQTLFSAPDFTHPHLPGIYRDFALALGLDAIMDPAVYSEGKGRLWRVAGKRRQNGSRKIPLTLAQLTNLTIDEIVRLSREARHIPEPSRKDLPPNRLLCQLFDGVVSIYESNRRKAVERKKERRKATPKKRRPTDLPRQWDDPDINQIESLLNDLPDTVVHEYSDWLRVGMALHHASEGEAWGLALWDAWSQQSPKYEEEALQQRWDGFRQVDNGVTLGTLFYLARRTKQKGPR